MGFKPSTVPAPQLQLVTNGETTGLRVGPGTTFNLTSNILRLSAFTASKTEMVNNLRTLTQGTAAGATPTLCRMSLYVLSGDGTTLNLVCATANDVTLWAAINTSYTRSTTAPGTKIAGQRYAFAALCVTAAAVPSMAANTSGLLSSETALAPWIAATLAAQNDLPASIAVASLSFGSGAALYGGMTP